MKQYVFSLFLLFASITTFEAERDSVLLNID